jgi:hypothetical protein
MAVGTGNITLQDVTTEIYGDTNSGRSLTTCFSSSSAGTFNPTYVGVKDRLSNFKGYSHVDDGIWGVDEFSSIATDTNLC